ncbi:unnamed protein product [Caretta caretta]
MWSAFEAIVTRVLGLPFNRTGHGTSHQAPPGACLDLWGSAGGQSHLRGNRISLCQIWISFLSSKLNPAELH